jgi:N-acetylglucosamine-6-phosphate deacetylase
MIYNDVKIFGEKKIINKGWIEVENGKIKNFGSGSKRGISLAGLMVVPGFIDIHFHGSFGIDLMTADQKGYQNLSKNLLKYGVTSYLATTLTDDATKLKTVLNNLSSYIKTQIKGLSQMVGIHLEGPFISKKYAGAQDQRYIINPNLKLMKEFIEASNHQIKLITYAPELAPLGFTRFLCEQKIIASAGHSAANYDLINQEVKNGLSNITHFNNAHSSYHHRNPGMVNAGLENESLNLELIVDKLHVHPSVVRLVAKLRSPKKIMLVTDACMATGLKDGKYDLGSQKVVKKENSIRLQDGTLAASLLNMNAAVQNMQQITNAKISDLILMASTNQARLLNLKKKGIIKKGNDADLVFMDDKLQVQLTLVNGETGYQSSKIKI